MTAGSPEDLIHLGFIAHPHGTAGAVRLRLTGEPEHLGHIARVYLDGHGWRVVRSLELHHRTPVLTLAGIDDRDAAEALRGTRVYVEPHHVQLGEGEYFYNDLIGRPARDPHGRPLGTIRDIIDTGAQDVLVLDHDNREVLVPLQAPYVRVLDDSIEIEPIPGLLDES